MAALAVMWEARAADGRGADLLEWARARELSTGAGGATGATGAASAAGTGGVAGPRRRETFTAPGDRVLVITWWPAGHDAVVPELPDPPAELVSRPVHRWRFVSVDVSEPLP